MNQMTVKNLLLNKKRTIVTIIGIVLATALITAVAGLAESFRQTMIQDAKDSEGHYHYAFYGVKAEDLKYFEENRNIESFYQLQGLGYAKLEGSKNEDKPYLYVLGTDQNGLKNAGFSLEEGRMPENDHEVVISSHIESNAKVEFKIGDTIILDVGERRPINSDFSLGQRSPYQEGEEELVNLQKKEYQIVGIMNRPNYGIEIYTAPGYTILTYQESKTSAKSDLYALYTKKGLQNQDEVTGSILQIDANLLKKSRGTELLTETEQEALENAKYNYTRNASLLRWENLEMSDSSLSMLYSVCGVVIGIIIVTSVFCIRNSFAISITEKMKQYGMLASVGATSKQIKKNVLYEAMILAVIGIPIGVLGGIFAVFVLVQLVNQILGIELLGVNLVFAISGIATIISVLLALITIYLSAIASARKAARVSPIEAIRNNQDIKIDTKKIKSPKIIKKIFGIGGEIAYKNLKRNKKKYRTTVISIVVSVSIFIAMFSFINYAFQTSSIYYETREYNLAIYGNGKEEYEYLKKIEENEKVEKASLENQKIFTMPASQVKYGEVRAKEKEELLAPEEGEEESEYLCFMSVGKAEYERFLKKLGLSYDEYHDKAILINQCMRQVNVDGKMVYKSYPEFAYQEGEKITVTDQETQKEITVEIGKITDELTMSLEGGYINTAYFIVSDEWMEEHNQNYEYVRIYIQTKQADELEEEIYRVYGNESLSVSNFDATVREENAMWLVISIFLYGFITVISLIGITNIFNTITTNMMLRSKEFAMLKSVGMTSKEFKRMIRLESLFYGVKSLCIGVPIGLILSYLIYKAFAESAEMGFLFPTNGVIISVVVVFVLIGGIMHYSLKKINQQNIIETIRQDNI